MLIAIYLFNSVLYKKVMYLDTYPANILCWTNLIGESNVNIC